MPLQGVDLTSAEKLMTFEEQKRALSIFSVLGITKVRFTGGEPTLNKKLPELIRHARLNKAILSIGITTNGNRKPPELKVDTYCMRIIDCIRSLRPVHVLLMLMLMDEIVCM